MALTYENVPSLTYMRRRIHVIWGGGYMALTYENVPSLTYMRRRIHVI